MRVIFFISLFFTALAADSGICEIDTLDTKNAQECIERVLKKEPDNIRCIVKLADLHLRQGDLMKGFKLIGRAYKINPTGVKESRVANILDFALKINKLEKYASENRDTASWNEIGNSFYDMGVYKEALEAYKNSLDIDEHQEEIALKLALSYKNTGQNYIALEQLKAVLKINENNFYANYFLGKIFKYSIKDVINSKKYFRKARSILEANEHIVSAKEYPQFISDIIYELSI